VIILLTNIRMSMLSGAQTFTRDLALALRAAGHTPVVYTPKPGLVSDELVAHGVRVETSLADVTVRPDIIHGNQHAELVAAIVQFPDVPAIFTCHGPTEWADHPPSLRRIVQYVAIDDIRRDRVLRQPRIAPDDVTIIGNSVDMARFPPRAASLPPTPRRALLVSNYATTANFGGQLAAACDAIGLPIEIVGHGVRRVEQNLPDRLATVDVVFAVGRSAMEAMATGAACTLCDRDGLGPLVTPQNVAVLQARNFGRALASDPITPDALAARLDRYDPADAARVQQYIRSTASVEAMAAQYERVYRLAIADRRELPPLSEDIQEYINALYTVFLAFLKSDAIPSPAQSAVATSTLQGTPS
jgi:hypothetical protein